jgi:cation:H+ antiporter
VPLALLLVVSGLGALLLGGEGLVTGAVRLAKRLGVSPLAIGLTVVAFGTSAPELAVSIIAALEGTPDIAVGNVFGSNIFNILVAVGVPAAMTGLVVRRELFRREIPFCVLANVLVIGLAWTGRTLLRWEGILLLFVLCLFLIWVAKTGRSDGEEDDIQDDEGTAGVFALVAIICGLGAAAAGHESPGQLWFLVIGAVFCVGVMHFNRRMGGLVGSILLLPIGLVLLVVGSQVLVVGATSIARGMEISEATIGLTVVAIGTSAPELAAGIIAARRGLSDIVLGNAIGSNLFNLLSVLGAASVIHPIAVAEQFLAFDAWIALLTVVLLLPLAATKTGRLSRFGGLLLVCLWVAYTTMLLVMESTASP